ncbi:hypothetical protein IJ818_05920 [bacterium]|nr:hypothetical protein [bacterium]
MAFIGASIQKRSLMLQKQNLEFQQMCKQNTQDYWTERAGDRETYLSRLDTAITNANTAKTNQKNRSAQKGDQNTDYISQFKQTTDYKVMCNAYKNGATDVNSGLNSSDNFAKIDKGTDSTYVMLKGESDRLELEIDALDSQLTIINSQLDATGKLVENNIQQDCTLWCVGGG